MSVESDFKQIIKNIEDSGGLKISNAFRLTGGSINESFVLNTTKGKQVLKINDASSFPGMFDAEKVGLDLIRSKSNFIIPEVLDHGKIGRSSFLLLEFIEEGQENTDFWRNFVENLASLHSTSSSAFGFPSSNYIGSLPQYNFPEETAADFYINQRLEPQLKMAADLGFKFSSLETILKNIAGEIPLEPPSLIHGDLWSGNYLITKKGLPALIDPAVSYGPREMDLAMMRLFGGFPEQVFEMYFEIYPVPAGSTDRVDLWQLYYLLVHLNIFGSGYLSEVEAVLDKYS